MSPRNYSYYIGLVDVGEVGIFAGIASAVAIANRRGGDDQPAWPDCTIATWSVMRDVMRPLLLELLLLLLLLLPGS